MIIALLLLLFSLTFSESVDNQVLYPDSGYSELLSRNFTEQELKQSHSLGNFYTYYNFTAPYDEDWCFGGKQGVDFKTQVFITSSKTETFTQEAARIPLDKIYDKSAHCVRLNSQEVLHLISYSHTHGRSEIGISVRSGALTQKYSQHLFHWLTFYFGLIMAFILAHLVLGVFSKFAPSFWYALLLFFYGLSSLLYSNMESLIFNSHSPWWQSDTPLMITASLWALSGFTLSYFHQYRFSRLVQVSLFTLPTISLIVNVLARFSPQTLGLTLMLESFILQLIFILIAVGVSKIPQKSYTRMFLTGWGVFLLGFVIFTVNEIFPSGNTLIAMYSTTLAHLFEMVLFTLFFGYQIIQQERAAMRGLKKSRNLANQLLNEVAEKLPGQLASIRYAEAHWDQDSKNIWEISAHRLELSLRQMRTVAGIDEEEIHWQFDPWIEEIQRNFYQAYLTQKIGSEFVILSHLTQTIEFIPHKLHLAAQIILDNAFKFSTDKKVILEIGQQDHNLTLKIHDDGPGFPHEIMDNYQTHFWQESKGLTRSHQGLGLGFKVIHELLSKETAFWELGSSPLLGGALFEIHFPVAWENQPQESFEKKLIYSMESQYNDEFEHTPKERFLLVDDNPINLKVLAKMVAKLGCEYDLAENGEIALERFKEFPDYSGVLMDIQMPVIDGLEATRQIRLYEAENSLVKTPIVAITAHASYETERDCLTAGMQGMIAKPMRYPQLEELLDQIHKDQHQFKLDHTQTQETHNLLVVDDNLINRKVLCKMANKLGFETVQAENGQEGFDFYSGDYEFVGILMDLQMPLVDGLEATRMVRHYENQMSLPHLPIIAVTAHSGPETLAQCLEVGMQGMISKPFTQEKLLQILHENQINPPIHFDIE